MLHYLDLYKKLLFIRLLEQMIADEYGAIGQAQSMRCPMHLSVGQETAAVGVCSALDDDDTIFSTHRCHAHYLAKNGDPLAMIMEMHGKKYGNAGGRGGSMHLMDVNVNMIASVPIIGSSIPLSVGAALSHKMDMKQGSKPRVSVSFFGDAALEEGVFHESMVLAQTLQVPHIFVCENNHFSINTTIDKRQSFTSIKQLVDAYNIPFFTADSWDVEALYHMAHEAITYSRDYVTPSFIYIENYRKYEHCGPNNDEHLGYKQQQDITFWDEHDGVVKAKEQCLKKGYITQHDHVLLEQQYKYEIASYFKQAMAAPFADINSVRDYVYHG